VLTHQIQKKLTKGKTRWNQFAAALKDICPEKRSGPILDFGCGIGCFVLEGLRRKMDMWGVDQSTSKIKRYGKLAQLTSSPPSWEKRCFTADGADLPFKSNTFAAISSWYVFEHIREPGEVLRELVRVTRRGGVIAIRAQDARNGWEGHVKIPWVPFLSGRLAVAWIEAFGKSPSMRQGIYDITQPQFISILKTLGCRIAIQAPEPRVLIENHQALTTEAEVRRKARQVRAKFETGEWVPQPENLYIYAQKL
jgi:ubiquinone/menaquinone biosynthesis C-methylase UbiE